MVDTELRPDAEEGRALKRVMSAPGDSLASSDLELLWKFRPVWKSKFYGAFVLNRRAPDTLVDSTQVPTCAYGGEESPPEVLVSR